MYGSLIITWVGFLIWLWISVKIFVWFMWLIACLGCSCGGMGGREATGYWRSGGGATTEEWSSFEDPLHFIMPHWCLLLGSQGKQLTTNLCDVPTNLYQIVCNIDMITVKFPFSVNFFYFYFYFYFYFFVVICFFNVGFITASS